MNTEKQFSLYERLQKLDKERLEVASQFLEDAFSNGRTEYKIPDWLIDNVKEAEMNLDFPCTYCSYRHDGAWVQIYGVSKGDGGYYCCGQENEEYMSDWVDDIRVDNKIDVMDFIFTYNLYRFDEMLEDMRQSIKNCHRVADISIVIEEWCEKWEFCVNEIKEDDVLKWVFPEETK